MKFNCGPSAREQFEATERWHRFFALWPRRVGPRDCRWLEVIERKGTWLHSYGGGFWKWEYRAIV
jgi:hypothetical protein